MIIRANPSLKPPWLARIIQTGGFHYSGQLGWPKYTNIYKETTVVSLINQTTWNGILNVRYDKQNTAFHFQEQAKKTR